MARTGRWIAGGTAVVLVLGAGGYLAADAADLVPGFVTTAPVPTPAAPFPSAPGAIVPPPVAALPGPDPLAPVPDPGAVTDLVAALVADGRMGTSTGVVIADVLTGTTLAEVSGTAPRTPASVAKLFTAAAALTVLGPETRIATTVVQSEPGTIVLVGGGDMMLAAGTGDVGAVNGRAGLADLAAQVSRTLRLQGRTEVTLAVDTSVFQGGEVHHGWAATDLSMGYVAPIAPLAVDVAKTRTDVDYPPRHADPAGHTAQVLSEALAAEGVTVTGVQRGVTAAADAVELGRIESATVAEVASYVLVTSDNAVSEALGRLVAVASGLPGSFDGATRAITAAVGTLGVDVGAVTLADASGLADGSTVPATTVVELILALTQPAHSDGLRALTGLAVAGTSGTLLDRLTSPPALGVVRAKTGSLRGVTTLAGTVLTREGRLLAFAVLADQTPEGGQWGPRAAIDVFVQNLAACGCRAP